MCFTYLFRAREKCFDIVVFYFIFLNFGEWMCALATHSPTLGRPLCYVVTCAFNIKYVSFNI